MNKSKISAADLLDYKIRWDKLNTEIRQVWNMFLTQEGKFWGLTDFMMRKINEAKEEGKQEAFEELQNRTDEDES